MGNGEILERVPSFNPPRGTDGSLLRRGDAPRGHVTEARNPSRKPANNVAERTAAAEVPDVAEQR